MSIDNIFIERLGRTVKYEEVYIKDYQSISEARENFKIYFDFYNNRRLHSSIGYKPPFSLYNDINQDQSYSFINQEKIMENFEIRYYYKDQSLPQFIYYYYQIILI